MATFLISNLLRQKKFQTLILFDDGLLSHYDNIFRLNELKNESKLSSIKRKIISWLKLIFLRLLDDVPLKAKNYLLLSKLSQVPSREEVDKFIRPQIETRSFHPHIEASFRRFFSGKSFQINNLNHLKFIRSTARNHLILSQAAKNIIRKYQCHGLITLDGIYVTAGSLRDIFENNGIRTISYQPSYQKNRAIKICQQHVSIENMSIAWKKIQNDQELIRRISQVGREKLNARTNIKDYSPSVEEKEVFDKICQAKKRTSKTIALFPNIPWDAGITQRDKFFKGLEDWIRRTCEFALSKNMLVIIREHPLPEHLYHQDRSIQSMLEVASPEILDHQNLLIIDGKFKMNSYYLVSNYVDLSILYSGTLIPEISHMQLPLIFAANSPYSKKEVAYEPLESESYFNAIENYDSNHQQFIENKQRYALNSELVFGFQFDFNIYYFPLFPEVSKFRPSANDDKYWDDPLISSQHFVLDNNPELQRTVNYIVDVLKV